MKERFSKKRLIAVLRDRADQLKQVNGFTNDTGTIQLQSRAPKIRVEAAVQYGHWQQLINLISELEN